MNSPGMNQDFGAPLEAHGVSQGDFALPGYVYQIGLPPRRIDILTQVSGLNFEEFTLKNGWEARKLGRWEAEQEDGSLAKSAKSAKEDRGEKVEGSKSRRGGEKREV